jgi:hypothetical protein
MICHLCQEKKMTFVALSAACKLEYRAEYAPKERLPLAETCVPNLAAKLRETLGQDQTYLIIIIS